MKTSQELTQELRGRYNSMTPEGLEIILEAFFYKKKMDKEEKLILLSIGLPILKEKDENKFKRLWAEIQLTKMGMKLVEELKYKMEMVA